MDPIRSKVSQSQQPTAFTVARPLEREQTPETVVSEPRDALILQESEAKPAVSETSESPKLMEAVGPASPAPKNPEFRNEPQAILSESELETAVVSSAGKTLAQVASEVAGSKLAAKPQSAATKPLSNGVKTSLLRRLGHAFSSFLSSDPLKPLQRELQAINSLSKSLETLRTPEQFQAKTAEFKQRLSAGESLEQLRPEAYAVARLAASVSLGLNPYDCQVLGALAMDDGHIAEMKTGEGKTLTALLPLYLNALMGKGAHLVTVNDTLASRDSEEMTPAFNLLGLSVGTVLEGMTPEQKRAGYAADVTYTTDRSLGFDYLRDQTAKNPAQKVQREPFFALIDEVDEVLIDEARSPLIVSGSGLGHQAEYREFNEVVKSLVPGKDYYLDRKQHSVWLSETGLHRVENLLLERSLQSRLSAETDPQRLSDLGREQELRRELHAALDQEQASFQTLQDLNKNRPGLLERWRGAEWDKARVNEAQSRYESAVAERSERQSRLPGYNLFSEENSHRVRFLYASLKAHALFERGDDYTVGNGKVEIVDENKGRTSEGRRYNDGVHQAIEAKEQVEIGDDQRTIASITYPNLFKRYPRLSGMSGTAKTSEAEFIKLYSLDAIPIPTNKPVIREDRPDLIFRTLSEKFEAVADDAARDFFEGKPVLIGTLSVEHNEYLAKLLQEKGIPRDSLQVLNAETVRGDKEGENAMIGQAGRSGVITVATNLAGRGANIKPDLVNFKKLAEQSMEAATGGRPVSITLNKKKEAEWLNAWLGEQASVVEGTSTAVPGSGQIQIRYRSETSSPENEPVWQGNTLHLAGDDFPTGGLTVYGTERSTSRRIDNQLIGRSGRQGAPGSSRFYLSLEDDLPRIFAGSKLDSVVSHFLEPGVGIGNPLLDKVMEQAQSSVEADHFAARESTNKQDEVLNIQRDTFFTLRNELLEGGKPLRDRFESMVANAVSTEVRDSLPEKPATYSFAQIAEAVNSASKKLQLPLPLAFLDPVGEGSISRVDLEHELRDLISRQTGQILRGLEKTTGRAEEAVRPLVLDAVDDVWAEHLEGMDALRQGVQWQSLAQHDPEVEYKLRGYDLFAETVREMERRVATGLFKDLLAFSQVLQQNAGSKAV